MTLLISLAACGTPAAEPEPQDTETPALTDPFALDDTPAGKAILSAADARRNAILNSETEVEYTGTAYYISHDGDDDNDGRSETSPWATLTRLDDAELQSGDAVFFRRGGLWRGTLHTWDGVTYSAYGEGDKPLFYNSPESGVGAEKWSLVPGTGNIWVFHLEMNGVSAIVFNGGESFAVKRMPSYVDGQFVTRDDPSVPFDVARHLEKDLTFFSEGDKAGSLYADEDRDAQFAMIGKVYLRCDAGNPGEVYSSIEFSAGRNSVENWGAVGVTLDNLHFMYSAESGTSGGYTDCTVQNCAFGWIGGIVIAYDAAGRASVGGDGIKLDGERNRAVNNYLYQIYDYALASETGDYMDRTAETPHKMRDLTISGNLVERCGDGVLVINWYEGSNENNLASNIAIRDNLILYSGYGWAYENHLEDASGNDEDMNYGACLSFFEAPNANDGTFLISDNTFYLARWRLVWGEMPDKYKPTFEGNTYAQTPNGCLGRWRSADGEEPQLYYAYENAESFIRSVLCDKTGTLLQ